MHVWQVAIVLRAKSSDKILFSGPKTRGAFLGLVDEVKPGLSNILHDSKNRIAPYALRPLRRVGKVGLESYLNLEVVSNEKYVFHVSIFDKEIFMGLVDGLSHSIVKTMRIGEARFEVEKMVVKKVGLETPKPKTKLILEFMTPTYFKSVERPNNVLLPLPELVIGSAARIWNAFVSEDYEVRELCERVKKSVRIIAHKIRTVPPIKISKNRTMVGFVGRVSYEILDEEVAKVFTKLAKFAEITNVGGGRTAGFGVVRVF